MTKRDAKDYNPLNNRNESLADTAAMLQQWMMTQALPLWADAGMHTSGAACEALDWDGSPVDGDESRVRVQARQLYCFALAHQLGWQPDRSRRIVENLFRTIRESGRRKDGLYGRRINLVTGQLIDDTPDLYDNAFVLLGFANARQVLGASAVDPAIDEFLQSLDAGLAYDQNQGYAEFLPAPDYRLQNPHMHLFESTLGLFAATGDDHVRGRVRNLRSFIEATFFNVADSCVDEVVGSDDPATTFEPGHSMEWVWLLGWQARLLDEPYPDFGHVLYARAVETLDEQGRAVMQVATSGERTDPSRRLWSQTETLKAHLCMVEQLTGADAGQAARRATACAINMLEEWLQPAIAGGWQDHFNEDGSLVATNMPASSGYHLYCAIAELMRVAAARAD